MTSNALSLLGKSPSLNLRWISNLFLQARALRQRMDQVAKQEYWRAIILEESTELLKKFDSPVTPIVVDQGDEKVAYLPLDLAFLVEDYA
jgi:hypothetical protein